MHDDRCLNEEVEVQELTLGKMMLQAGLCRPVKHPGRGYTRSTVRKRAKVVDCVSTHARKIASVKVMAMRQCWMQSGGECVRIGLCLPRQDSKQQQIAILRAPFPNKYEAMT